MNTTSDPKTTTQPSWLDKICRTRFIEHLKQMRWGTIELKMTDSTEICGSQSPDEPHVVVNVYNDKFFTAVALKRDIGAGEAYAAGHFDADCLITLISILLHNDDTLDNLEGSRLSSMANAIHRFVHRMNHNTKSGSKKNISAHYDLGNDFFAHWLDSRMMYSAGIYLSDDATLEDAQLEKIDRICRKLQLKAGQTVVEIGSGWGGFAIHAARRYGVHVTTTTISQEQHDYAVKAIEKAGLSDKITVLLKDYRDLKGQYDALVSIEMIEAVGDKFLDSYFKQVNDLLKPDGQAVIQAILMRDHRYKDYVKETDFIRHHIFPGGCLPSMSRIHKALASKTSLKLHHLEDFGPHYAQTLADWHQRMLAAQEQLPEQNQDPWFFRMWEFYLCCCSALFAEQRIGVSQLHYIKPYARPEPVLMDVPSFKEVSQ